MPSPTRLVGDPRLRPSDGRRATSSQRPHRHAAPSARPDRAPAIETSSTRARRYAGGRCRLRLPDPPHRPDLVVAASPPRSTTRSTPTSRRDPTVGRPRLAGAARISVGPMPHRIAMARLGEYASASLRSEWTASTLSSLRSRRDRNPRARPQRSWSQRRHIQPPCGTSPRSRRAKRSDTLPSRILEASASSAARSAEASGARSRSKASSRATSTARATRRPQTVSTTITLRRSWGRSCRQRFCRVNSCPSVGALLGVALRPMVTVW